MLWEGTKHARPKRSSLDNADGSTIGIAPIKDRTSKYSVRVT